MQCWTSVGGKVDGIVVGIQGTVTDEGTTIVG
jgi:hypothetical protein